MTLQPVTQQQSQSSTGSSKATPPLVTPPAADFFRGYQLRPGRYDEVFAQPGQLRPHWSRFVQDLNQLGGDEFVRRWEHSRLLVHENGIAYSAFGDPNENARPWELDPFPLLIDHGEWSLVASGLQQRAELLNRVLADLYGPQSLISDGILPPEILFLHPGFHRPYHDVEAPAGRWLHNYAADLARGPEGRWWVLADRAEAPSGVGFALENRVVLSRMLPSCFRNTNVRRLAGYFMNVQESLKRLSPRQRDNPRIVLLSQGTASANYFEDAYLARYLGYTLVEGDDLAIRTNEVMLKTLSGLLPVDVVLRRPNSVACDSLELGGHLNHGSPGLLEAVRAKSVGIANALGSGLVESPVFMAYLPALAQHLLQETLKLPTLATWWCGRADHWQFVRQNIDRLIVKPAFRQRGSDRHRSRQLCRMSRDELLRCIEKSPHEYVAQERAARSTMPRWKKGTFDSVHVSLRAFAWHTGDNYQVLHGGLTRTSSTDDPLEPSVGGGEGRRAHRADRPARRRADAPHAGTH